MQTIRQLDTRKLWFFFYLTPLDITCMVITDG